MQVQVQQSQKPIFIYRNMRGMGQIIRNVFFYIEVPFDQIHLNRQCKIVCQKTACLIPQNLKINCDDLPYLYHQGKLVHQVFAIISYICRRFDKTDLLGKNAVQRARVNQLMQKYAINKSHVYTIMMRCMQKIKQNPNRQQQFRKLYCNYFISGMQYLDPLLKLYQRTKSYLLGHFTILDIVLYQIAFYGVNLFRDLGDQFKPISLMTKYKQFFENQPFFKKNMQKQNVFPILCQQYPSQSAKYFKACWKGEKTQFK